MLNRQTNIPKNFNWTVLAYIGLVGLMSLVGLIRFGHGLADLIILLYILISTVIHVPTTLFFIRIKNVRTKNIALFILGFCFLFFAIWLTWKFTYGRGIESKWDGYIFNDIRVRR